VTPCELQVLSANLIRLKIRICQRAAKIIAVSFSPLKQVTLWIDKKTFYPFCCPLLETMSIYNTVASGNGNIEFFEEKARLKF